VSEHPSIDERLVVIIDELQSNGITMPHAVEQFRRKYLTRGLTRSKGRFTAAAKLLGVHRNTLHNAMPRVKRVSGPSLGTSDRRKGRR
jgi:transcriptional regulator of acetoin/glycerol metabolism